jgi:hypothetical protein
VKNQPDYHRRTPFSASTFLPRTVHSVTEVRRGLTPGQEQPSSAREQLESVYGDAKLEAVTCRSLHRRVQDSIRSWLPLSGRGNECGIGNCGKFTIPSYVVDMSDVWLPSPKCLSVQLQFFQLWLSHSIHWRHTLTPSGCQLIESDSAATDEISETPSNNVKSELPREVRLMTLDGLMLAYS